MSYFVSGFIFLKIFCFLSTKKQGDISLFIIWCVVTSFIIKSIVIVIYPQAQLHPWIATILYVSFGIMLAFIFTKIYESKLLQKLIVWINHKSINNDVWKDIIDYSNGTTIKVFLKNTPVVYIGVLISHEENGNDSWFVFKDYIAEYEDGKEFNAKTCSYPSTVAINLREISRMELFYNEDTKVFS